MTPAGADGDVCLDVLSLRVSLRAPQRTTELDDELKEVGGTKSHWPSFLIII